VKVKAIKMGWAFVPAHRSGFGCCWRPIEQMVPTVARVVHLQLQQEEERRALQQAAEYMG
jgi:hypothetical protein